MDSRPVGGRDQIRPLPRRFPADARLLRRGLLRDRHCELGVTGEHAIAVADLPPTHKDPSDRLLVAEAAVEGSVLLTAEAVVARYPGAARKV